METLRDAVLVRAVSGFNGGNPSLYPGAFPPPAGVVPNLHNAPDAGRRANIAGLSVCLGVTTILVAVRAYVKLRVTRRLLLEDLTCLIAWFLLVVFTATSAMMVRYGLGHHSWDVSVGGYASMLEWLYITSLMYEPAAFFTKATLLLLLARVFAINTVASRGIYCFICGLFVAYVPILVLKIDICGPIAAFWNPLVPGECLNLRKFFIIDVAFAIATDSLILIIPIPLTWHLGISWLKKIKIILLLGAGGVATAVTIYRLIKLITYLSSSDVASDFVLLDFLTMLELSIGLSCSCFPALNILIEHIRAPKRRGLFLKPGNHGLQNRRRRTSGFAWSWLGTTMSIITPKLAMTGTTAHDGQHVEMITRTSNRTHFDMELAMLSGQDDDYEQNNNHNDNDDDDDDDERQLQNGCPLDSSYREHWFNSERATACHGRREGWLDSCPHSAADGSLGAPSTGEGQSSDETCESKKSREITNQLAEISGNKQWEYIWDGRSNSVGSSSHARAGKGTTY